MQFENRSPDEGINAQPEHLGREAILLIVGAIVCVIGLVVLADVAASWLAPRLPFSLERELADRMEGEPPKLPAQGQGANAGFEELAGPLRGPLGMPEDITVKVRVDDSEVLNAYATVGGRIVIHRGLLRRLRGEHELAALLAHEMAHVQHRHAAASLGRGLGARGRGWGGGGGGSWPFPPPPPARGMSRPVAKPAKPAVERGGSAAHLRAVPAQRPPHPPHPPHPIHPAILASPLAPGPARTACP